MDKKAWQKCIRSMMDGVGTYRPEFDSVIDTLADILEQRDRAYQDFLDSGAEVVIKKVSDRGAENVGKNPRLQIWADLNAQALAFWRDLGLTPAGLKRIDETAIKNENKESALEAALKKIGGKELDGSKEIRGSSKVRKKGSVRRTKASRK